MYVAEEMRHDHQNREIFRWNFKSNQSTSILWDNIETINYGISQLKQKIIELKQIENLKAEDLVNWASELTQKYFNSQKYSFLVESDIVRKAKLFVSRYFWQEKTKNYKLLQVKPIQLLYLFKT